MLQETALKILQTGANVFLTGEPGSGKTHTVNQYVRWLEERGISPAVTASTGIAATHIGGYTIHSWSGIGIKRDLDLYALDKITQNERVVRRVRNTCVLIIDEVSMLSATTLGMVDRVCREIRHKDAPFGGLQVVLVGDFFQLPPVIREEYREEQTLDSETFEKASNFAFSARTWEALNPLVCYLSEQHRQEDKAFLELLSGIRRGAFTASHHALLEKRRGVSGRAGLTQLYSHNADVDRINDKELAGITGDARTFAMTSQGREALVTSLKRGCLSPETLSLKTGARVMFTKNDVERKFVNGTVGVVAGFEKETGYPIVKTNSGLRLAKADSGFAEAGRTFAVEPMEWHVEDGGKVLARIEQVPLRLAWAITVHKSQGMSLDGAHMDLSQAFEYGQGYVALSRVRTLAGLSLAGLNERALQVHPEVAKRDRDFKLRSASARKVFEEMPEKEHDALKHNFVVACGGRELGVSVEKNHARKEKRTISTSDSPKRYSLADIRAKHRNAYRPWTEEDDAELRRRYLSGEKVKELAEALGRQAGSISSRLVKFGLVKR